MFQCSEVGNVALGPQVVSKFLRCTDFLLFLPGVGSVFLIAQQSKLSLVMRQETPAGALEREGGTLSPTTFIWKNNDMI